ncbi:hypothetical protein BH10CYA1_BH10CYA1_04480 [soil metagenome]
MADFTGDVPKVESQEQQNIANQRNEAHANAMNEVMSSPNVVARIESTANLQATFGSDSSGDRQPKSTEEIGQLYGRQLAHVGPELQTALIDTANWHIERAAGSPELVKHMTAHKENLQQYMTA